ncbi:hypothetical protein TcasGA2_TC033817 [Tribolium castaneum]|uniref:C2HC/C3H-type domain-containing protein n=1 Tax=Tribolium castaneum TaxID=7070 RepID=A0A139WEJ6_TRICA|nr:hypothetical protein TcasGA2_TC033817 [Tribolium castaneum]
MPKKTNLKLFTKTWPQKKDGKKEERPLTATLDKPTVLNISLIGIIDMSTVRKEFLNISNLCRFPIALTITKRKKTPVINRPLSLPSPEKHKGCKKRPETSEDSYEEEESMSIQSAKIKPGKTNTTVKKPSILSKKKPLSDANNNTKTFKIPRKRAGTVAKLLEVNKNDLGKSTKLPEPCKTCGRPDQPERFHSHPATPLKIVKKEEPPKMKSTVQKPVAMKYKSKQSAEKKALPPAQRKPSLPAQKLVHTPPNVGVSPETATPRVKSAKRTLTCYLCGREFGTASLPLHEPKCLQKWERENASLPKHMQRKPPVKPDQALTPDEWNQYAWEASQATLTPCPKCGRTFYPDRLLVHQRSCKVVQDSSVSSGKLTLRSKLRLVFNNITVEPILVCFVLPCVMANLATQNLNMDKACRVNLHLSEQVCDGLALRDVSRYNQSDEVAVQKLVATMNAWKNVIQSFVPSLLLLFLGSWSDRHKRRKPCFLGPIIGEMVTCMGLLLCTFFYYQLPVEYNVFFEAVPPSLTGGWFAMFMAVFSYVGGITSVQTRTLRIGAVNIFVNISFTVGNALSGILYQHVGYYGIFSLSLLFYTIGFLYGLLIVKEIPNEGKTTNHKSFLRDFFDTKHIAETFEVAFKEGALIEIFNGTTFIAMRSIISKLVPPDELGKINSLFGLSEAMVPIIYGPLYSIVYKHTINYLPGTFFIVGGALTVPSLFIFCWLYREHKKDLEEDAQTQISKSSVDKSIPPAPMGPPSEECYICGKMFGTHSIKIHEKQCLKKWHVENDSLPADIRAPEPKKGEVGKVRQSPEPSSRRSSVEKEEKPSSGKKSPMFPCYICGRLFTVNSIYIHEPQCLKMWKIENDKLPPHKRRPQPLKPDIKFTPVSF